MPHRYRRRGVKTNRKVDVTHREKNVAQRGWTSAGQRVEAVLVAVFGRPTIKTHFFKKRAADNAWIASSRAKPGRLASCKQRGPAFRSLRVFGRLQDIKNFAIFAHGRLLVQVGKLT